MLYLVVAWLSNRKMRVRFFVRVPEIPYLPGIRLLRVRPNTCMLHIYVILFSFFAGGASRDEAATLCARLVRAQEAHGYPQ